MAVRVYALLFLANLGHPENPGIWSDAPFATIHMLEGGRENCSGQPREGPRVNAGSFLIYVQLYGYHMLF